MLDKGRIKHVAKIRRKSILARRQREEDEREERIKKTEAGLRTIGEAYQLLADGCEGDDTEIIAHFDRLWDFGNVTIRIRGILNRRCNIGITIGEYDEQDFQVCRYSSDDIEARDDARSISEGHVLEYNMGEGCRELAEWIIANPDSFIEKLLDNIEEQATNG